MKFDFAIGNPPYQEDRQGESKTALPIYHQFIDAVYQVSEVTELITPARFLFNAGRTPKNWNEKMLNDEHLKVLEYEPEAKKVFPNTEIKGGLAITYHNNKKKFGAIKTFTIFEEVNSILKKVLMYIENEKNFSSITFVASKFNTTTLFEDFPQYKGHERRMSSNVLDFECFHDEKKESDILVYGIYDGKRCKRYIDRKYVDISDENISKYKIVTPKADGNGKYGDILTKPEILTANSAFTHTFLGIGGFEKEEEARCALKYIKTKFVRALLGILKITQDLNAEKWKYVPLQNFTDNSDIDWSKSIFEIDQQLYKKYELSDEEIDFIEKNVKEMG